jgi:hypothetical protein
MMNYYTYISATKIDMLYPLIPSSERSQLFSATAAGVSSNERLIGRLNDVLAFLLHSDQIADRRSSLAPFIEASFPARSARYGWGAGELVMWIGDWIEDTTQIRVALGGSTHHLIGNTRPAEFVDSSSATPAIESALSHALGLTQEAGGRRY